MTLLTFKTRILPVIVITDVRQAVPMAHALLAGGIDAMEITLRVWLPLKLWRAPCPRCMWALVRLRKRTKWRGCKPLARRLRSHLAIQQLCCKPHGTWLCPLCLG